jgi:hypothetical protein
MYAVRATMRGAARGVLRSALANRAGGPRDGAGYPGVEGASE